MNRYLEKISAKQLGPSGPLAVIVKGNPKYLNHPKVKPLAEAFYSDLAKRITDKGFKVEFDEGKPYTLPDESAAVWIGHSRGMDRLDFAPEHIQTIYLQTNDTHHIHGVADRTGLDPAHYQLSDRDVEALESLRPNKYLEKIAQQLSEPAHPENLGIDLSKGSNEELNKWLIAVTLFSKPIQRSVAAKTSKQFTSEGITTADAVHNTGYDGLVKALGRGHYVRYDFAMSDTLLAQADHLKSKYGTLRNLIGSRTPEEIRAEIQSFKGIGPMGSKLFVEGLEPHLDKYRGPHEDVPLIRPTEDQTRLREILVNSSRRNLFNPYAKDKYDWSQYREERNDQGKLVKYHLLDKDTGEFVELHHPDVQKYRLRDAL